MKKTIIVLTFLCVPFTSFAASNDAVRSSIVAKLLETFVAQVQNIDFIIQASATADNPADFTTFKTLVQNQLAATTQQIAVLLNPGGEVQFGSITPTPVVPTPAPTPIPAPVVDKSEIIIKVIPNTYTNELRPYPEWDFIVKVLDTSGKVTDSLDISVTLPVDNNSKYTNPTTLPANKNTTPGRIGYVSPESWGAEFNYIPTTPGTKTLVFTSGSLTKSVTVEVK